MITLLTAFYQEAEAFIQEWNLKKEPEFSQFQFFSGDHLQLFITGTGSISSAIALTHLLTKIPPSPNDLYCNIGLCGCNHKEYALGTCFICNQIIEQATGRCFYPDILYSHDFLEAAVITSPSLAEQKDSDKSAPLLLFDMEAAGLYQAGMTFLQQHQMLFLKLVSDFLAPKQVTASEVSKLMKQSLPSILPFFDSLSLQKKKSSLDKITNALFSKQEEQKIMFLSEQFSFSVTRTEQFKQLFRYAKTAGISMEYCYRQLELFKEEDNPHRKKRGGEVLERFRQFIFTQSKESLSSYLY